MLEGNRVHMLVLPTWLLVFRILQIVVAVIILGLTGYGVTFLVYSGDVLSLFMAISTLIIGTYFLVSSFAVPKMYNYWAIMSLDIFAIIFWLISFAVLAAQVAVYSVSSYSCTYYYGYCYRKRDVVEKRATTDILTYRNAMAAAAGLGGLEFIFFIITLVTTSVYIHRHRKAGGHCSLSRSTMEPTTTHNAGIAGEKPVQHQPYQDPAQQQYQQQQQYPQQQYPQQTAIPQQQQQGPTYPQQVAQPGHAEVQGHNAYPST